MVSIITLRGKWRVGNTMGNQKMHAVWTAAFSLTLKKGGYVTHTSTPTPHKPMFIAISSHTLYTTLTAFAVTVIIQIYV